ncbi:hypothetical protein [Streptomyces sp. NPDC101455]|uniref:hypothetical protein n=1 Tax=Streptomyces sp. NPDC101455 TaxID=3366142 RepID=UPI00381D26EC
MPIVARPCLAAPASVVVAKYARVSTLDQLDGFGLEDQDRVSEAWLARHPEVAVHDSYVDEAVSGALERLRSLTPAERKEVVDLFDVRVVLGDAAILGKPGVRCAVSEWHWTTSAKVPPNPDDEQWARVLEVLQPFFTKRHFTSRYDIRRQFEGMLHRLRHGLTWGDMPLTWGPVDPIRVRQLSRWQKGAWPEVVRSLGGDAAGVAAYRRPSVPPLVVTAQFSAGACGGPVPARPCPSLNSDLRAAP